VSGVTLLEDKKLVVVQKSTFTHADDYVVDLAEHLEGEQRVVALAAVAIDTPLKQMKQTYAGSV
jgi:hypothetical protein